MMKLLEVCGCFMLLSSSDLSVAGRWLFAQNVNINLRVHEIKRKQKKRRYTVAPRQTVWLISFMNELVEIVF